MRGEGRRLGARAVRAIERAVFATFAITLAPAVAWADDAPKQRSEALFASALEDIQAGRYADACPKLEESQRLEPAVGTEFNLADCWTHVGKLAGAYRRFLHVADIAHQAGKFEREKLARARAAELAPRVPRLQLWVEEAPPGLEIEVDGERRPSDAWADVPVELGQHVIVARASSRRPQTLEIEVTAGGLRRVAIPKLEALPPPPSSTPTLAAPPSPERPRSRSTQPTIALVTGGVGLAVVAGGAIVGAMTLTSRARAERECPSATYSFHCPTPAGADAWNETTTLGDVSTVLFLAGGALVAAGTALWFTAPSRRSGATAVFTGTGVRGTF